MTAIDPIIVATTRLDGIRVRVDFGNVIPKHGVILHRLDGEFVYAWTSSNQSMKAAIKGLFIDWPERPDLNRNKHWEVMQCIRDAGGVSEVIVIPTISTEQAHALLDALLMNPAIGTMREARKHRPYSRKAA